MSDQVERTIYHRDWQGAQRPLISSVRIIPQHKHARIRVWNRGGCSGDLVVNAEDAEAIVDRLIPPPARSDPADLIRALQSSPFGGKSQ